MFPERRVRLFRNGRNQALRIPRDFELPGNEAIVCKEGNRLVVEPVTLPSLLAVLASLEPLDEDFPEIEDPLEEPVDARYAELRLALEGSGTPIGGNDMLIAAHALALELILVTANEREFSRVPDLYVENWLAL
jgi:antitoxin VapB